MFEPGKIYEKYWSYKIAGTSQLSIDAQAKEIERIKDKVNYIESVNLSETTTILILSHNKQKDKYFLYHFYDALISGIRVRFRIHESDYHFWREIV